MYALATGTCFYASMFENIQGSRPSFEIEACTLTYESKGLNPAVSSPANAPRYTMIAVFEWPISLNTSATAVFQFIPSK